MMRARLNWTWMPAFVAFYVVLDRVSYIQPLFGLNITPWNPGPALGLVCWLRFGRATAIPWMIGLVAAEYLTRGAPQKLVLTLLVSACLVTGYGLIGEALRRSFPDGDIFDNRQRLLAWLLIVVCGTLANSLAYISLLYLLRDIPAGLWFEAFAEFSVGDVVGVVVSMPFFWLVSSRKGRSQLRSAVGQAETAGYFVLMFFMLWLVFSVWRAAEFRHFYFLFLPLVWAASRQGVAGAATAVFLLQVSFMIIVQGMLDSSTPVVELQLLAAVLGTATLFLGVVVDEHRRVSEELQLTIRLASAGEMAAALAHELNQPMTALSAYVRTCQKLLTRGDTGEVLQKAIEQLAKEAGRATEVVRRLRDFFRTGAVHLEPVDLRRIIASAIERFDARAHEQQTALLARDIPEVRFFADSLQIEVVLHNLLANALDSVATLAPDSPREVVVTAAVMGGNRLAITVEDSGPGISAEVAERLFKSFSSTKPTGLGLGLVISKAITEAHGGDLAVEIASRGIFRLSLPIHERDTDAKE